MKARLLCALAAGALLVLACPGVAGATMIADRFVALAADGYQYHPAVSGHIVVFQQKVGGDWDIFGRDLQTHTTFPICTLPGDQILPDISGSLVVWEDHRNGKGDIYSYDLGTHVETAVCTQALSQQHPRVDNGWIVWQDHRDKDWDIYGEMAGGTASAICAAAGDQIEPDVCGDNVVWTDKRVAGDADIRGYNRVADFVFQVCVAATTQDQPVVSAHYVVWRDARNAGTTGTDIYGFDLRTSSEFVVTTAVGNQKEPAISGDIVAYTDGSAVARDGLDVWAHDITFDQELPLVVSSGWQGHPAIDGDTVVWGDAHDSVYADLHGVTLSPWFARLRFASGSMWTRTATVTLYPYARSKGGVVTQTMLANPPDAGVWEPYSPVREDWTLSSGDGAKKVTAVYADLSGDQSVKVSATITLDTHGPTCTVPKAVTVAHGGTATIGYRVDDNLSPQADVVLRVKNRTGAIVKAVVLNGRTVGKALSYAFVCNLAADTYRISIEATDKAGNAQVKRGTNTLTVTP